MKRLLVTVGLFLTSLSVYAQAAPRESAGGSNPRAVTSNTSPGELSQILLACMNQPGFEKYYNANGADVVNVLEKSGIQLSAKATALGRNISFYKKEASRTGELSNFFSIGEVVNKNGKVKVSLTYFYNHTKAGYKTVMVDMALAKKRGQYQIVNSNFVGDLL